ncbi:reverse transcriptase domain-containing protein [Tanacetum coccineum]
MGELAEDEITDKFPDEHLMILKAKINDEKPWGNKYILVAVDYMSKWVKAQALPINDARVVVKILKGLFARFGVPKALISDRGTHFCNSQMGKALLKYKEPYGVSLGLRYDVLIPVQHDLAIRKSTIWYTLKKTCVELVRAF